MQPGWITRTLGRTKAKVTVQDDVAVGSSWNLKKTLYRSWRTASAWYQSSVRLDMGDHGGRNPQNPRRNADRGHEGFLRNPRDVEEIARLQQRVRDLEMQQGERSEDETVTDHYGGDD
ncbi:hypothetical protein LXL04_003397 [Taraxacum kok-saghyz]